MQRYHSVRGADRWRLKWRTEIEIGLDTRMCAVPSPGVCKLCIAPLVHGIRRPCCHPHEGQRNVLKGTRWQRLRRAQPIATHTGRPCPRNENGSTGGARSRSVPIPTTPRLTTSLHSSTQTIRRGSRRRGRTTISLRCRPYFRVSSGGGCSGGLPIGPVVLLRVDPTFQRWGQV